MRIRKLTQPELDEMHKASRRFKSGKWQLLLISFEAMRDEVLDPNLDFLSWKPELLEAMEYLKAQKEQSNANF